MLVVANFADTEYKTAEKCLKPWHIGTHLRVLSESYPMNTGLNIKKIFISPAGLVTENFTSPEIFLLALILMTTLLKQ